MVLIRCPIGSTTTDMLSLTTEETSLISSAHGTSSILVDQTPPGTHRLVGVRVSGSSVGGSSAFTSIVSEKVSAN